MGNHTEALYPSNQAMVSACPLHRRARGFAAAGASANLTVTPTQPFEWYSISTINPETLEFCVPSKSAFCQALAAVECLPEGVDQCTADADGNIGSGNVGSNNLGNDNIGDYNKGAPKQLFIYRGRVLSTHNIVIMYPYHPCQETATMALEILEATTGDWTSSATTCVPVRSECAVCLR